MKNNYKKALILLAFPALLIACTRKATDFRAFLHGTELVYPGAITHTMIFPGNGRIKLAWHPSPDPAVSHYVVYWNNYADSLIVPAASHNPADTVNCLISNLKEYNYTFFIFSYDRQGNKSIATEIDNARVYGSIYQSNLFNRPVNAETPYVVSPDGASVSLHFLTPDTINISTVISYTDTSGKNKQKIVLPDSSILTLRDYKFGTPVLYRSSYIPVSGAIDTFYTSAYDTFPSIFRLVMCDKSLFAAMHLPHDMNAGFGTSLNQLWDGNMQPKNYPYIFHNDGSGTFPQHLSFDLGKVYSHLNKVQEIGRGCCHNPTDFEVWGIADTTGAITQLPGNDPGWKNEALSKGWTLLTEVVRTDNGIAPFNQDLISSAPPVRFIMIRVLKTYDDPNYVNISQFTFWYKE